MSKILRLPDVMQLIGLSKSSVYAYVSNGLITKPVKLGARAMGWPESDIAEINAARIAGKSDDDIRALVANLESTRAAAVGVAKGVL